MQIKIIKTASCFHTKKVKDKITKKSHYGRAVESDLAFWRNQSEKINMWISTLPSPRNVLTTVLCTHSVNIGSWEAQSARTTGSSVSWRFYDPDLRQKALSVFFSYSKNLLVCNVSLPWQQTAKIFEHSSDYRRACAATNTKISVHIPLQHLEML